MLNVASSNSWSSDGDAGVVGDTTMSITSCSSVTALMPVVLNSSSLSS